MNDTKMEKWNECFSQFRLLGSMTQQIMRRSSFDRLLKKGAEEVGSSDINYELFSMWEQSNGDWLKAMLFEVDNLSDLSIVKDNR